MPSEPLRDAISDQLVKRLAVIPSPEWLDETVNAIATAVEMVVDPTDGWNRACCAQEREACAQLAQETEEHGWGRKGFHRVADAIRGRGAWCATLAADSKRVREEARIQKAHADE